MGDTVDTMDTHMLMVYTMARDLLMLKLNPRLMLIPTFSMVDTMDMVLDTMDTDSDTTAMDTDTMARDLLMLSLRLMLTPTCCTEDMDMDTLDTVDTMDTHMVDMPTMDKLYRHKPYPAIANGQINHLCLLLQ